MSKKRKVEVAVISDVHLGTYGCHAKELLKYLKSIKPKVLILNGDIIDMWQFKKRYWPSSHMKVIKYLVGLLAKGVKIYYVTGNHDETLRKFSGFNLGSFEIVDKIELNLDGKRALIFHGDVFDITIQKSKWIAKLGGWSYDMLILVNRFVNYFSEKMGKGKVSLSKKIKNSVKSAVKFISDFEQSAAEMAIRNKFDYVVCGHIHQPGIRTMTTNDGEVLYVNSGDWIENLTSLEYNKGEWKVYSYLEDVTLNEEETEEVFNVADLKNKELFQNLLQEFQLMKV